MTDRLLDLMQQRFGETVEIPSNMTGIEQLETMLTHCSHRSFTSDAIAPALLRLLYACVLYARSVINWSRGIRVEKRSIS